MVHIQDLGSNDVPPLIKKVTQLEKFARFLWEFEWLENLQARMKGENSIVPLLHLYSSRGVANYLLELAAYTQEIMVSLPLHCFTHLPC